MKAEFKFVVIILALAALVSCGKITPAGGGSNEGGTEQGGGNTDPGTVPDTPLREISVAFDTKSTRTYLDGDKPEFKIGDYIRVAQADGNAAVKTYQVEEIHGGQLGFKTDLRGELVAVYPAERAIDDGYNITGVSVLSVQSGLFEDANICMADQSNEYPKPEDLNHLKFFNQTALIVVPVPQGTTQLIVTSLGKIENYYYPNVEGYGLRTDVIADINTAADDEARKQVTIAVDPEEPSKDYYVSVLPFGNGNELHLTDINIDAVVDDTHGYMGGFSPLLVSGHDSYTSAAGEPIYKSGIYYLPAVSLHEYIELDGLRWATTNVGAKEPEDYGNYYAWGDIHGHQVNSQFDEYKVTWTNSTYWITPEDGFSALNTPFYGLRVDYKQGYTVYNDLDSMTTLEPFDDAAFITWGGAWRMPTSVEFVGTFSGYSRTMNPETPSYTVRGITFPWAGQGDENSYWPGEGYYWTSSVNPENTDFAFDIFMNETLFVIEWSGDNSGTERYYGCSVRPVSGVYTGGGDEPDDDGLILEIDPYTNGWGTSN